MNLKILKLSIVGAFLAAAACFFVFSSARSQAQTGKSNERRDEILQQVADYKSWKQVLKPEKPIDEIEVVAQPVLSTTLGG